MKKNTKKKSKEWTQEEHHHMMIMAEMGCEISDIAKTLNKGYSSVWARLHEEIMRRQRARIRMTFHKPSVHY